MSDKTIYLSKQLSSDKFRKDIKLPFYYCRLDDVIHGLQKDIIDKWIDENISGDWWYTDSKSFVFGEKEDLVLFTMHYKSGIFSKENGNLEHIKENWFDDFENKDDD